MARKDVPEHEATRRRLGAVEGPVERIVAAAEATRQSEAAILNNRTAWYQACRWLTKRDRKRYSIHKMSLLWPIDERVMGEGIRNLPAAQTDYPDEAAARAVAQARYDAYLEQWSIHETALDVFKETVRAAHKNPGFKALGVSNKRLGELTGYSPNRFAQIKNDSTNNPERARRRRAERNEVGASGSDENPGRAA